MPASRVAVLPLVLLALSLACGGVDDERLFEGDEPGECSDLADNDRNGLFDCADAACKGSPACAAAPAAPEAVVQEPSPAPEPPTTTSKMEGVHCYRVDDWVAIVEVHGAKAQLVSMVENSDVAGPLYEGTLSGDELHVTLEVKRAADGADGTPRTTSREVDYHWQITPEQFRGEGAPLRVVACPSWVKAPG